MPTTEVLTYAEPLVELYLVPPEASGAELECTHVRSRHVILVLMASCGVPAAPDNMPEINLGMSDRLQRVLKRAGAIADANDALVGEPIHLLAATVYERRSMAEAILISAGVDVDSLRNRLVPKSHIELESSSQSGFSESSREVLIRALFWATELGDPYWGEEHLLIALAEVSDAVVQEILESFNVSVDDLLTAWKQIMGGQ